MANDTKKALYAELAEKIKAVKSGLSTSIKDVRDFAIQNDLVLLPEEIRWYDLDSNISHLVGDLDVPTEQQISEDWTVSNIDCGYKPEPDYTVSWNDSNCVDDTVNMNWMPSDSCVD